MEDRITKWVKALKSCKNDQERADCVTSIIEEGWKEGCEYGKENAQELLGSYKELRRESMD